MPVRDCYPHLNFGCIVDVLQKYIDIVKTGDVQRITLRNNSGDLVSVTHQNDPLIIEDRAYGPDKLRVHGSF